MNNKKDYYFEFKFWCRVFNDNKGQNDPKAFKQYLTDTNTKISDYELQELLETKFDTTRQDFDKLEIFADQDDKVLESVILRREKELQQECSRKFKTQKENGEFIYADFVEWVRKYHQNKGKHDAERFREYLKEEDVALTEKQRLFIATKYFGYGGEKDEKKKTK